MANINHIERIIIYWTFPLSYDLQIHWRITLLNHITLRLPVAVVRNLKHKSLTLAGCSSIVALCHEYLNCWIAHTLTHTYPSSFALFSHWHTFFSPIFLYLLPTDAHSETDTRVFFHILFFLLNTDTNILAHINTPIRRFNFAFYVSPLTY